MGRHAGRPTRRSPAGRNSGGSSSARLAAAAGTLSLAALADTLPDPTATLAGATPSPSPDVSGTVDSVTKTVSGTVSSVDPSASALPDPTASPSSVPTKVPGTGSVTDTSGGGGRTSGLGDTLHKVGGLLSRNAEPPHHSAPVKFHVRTLPAASVPLGDIPAMHGWGRPSAMVRTPVVAPAAPVVAPAPQQQSFAAAAMHGLATTVSVLRRILTIAATLLLGLIAAAHVRSAQTRSRSESRA